MAPQTVPLQALTVAVQNAVKQVLAKHGAVDVGHLWVGFVAPDTIATQENALKVAQALGRTEAGGANVQASVAQLAAGPAGAEKGVIPPKPGHIIGLIYAPKT
jgi:hypothetical protein